MRHIFISLAALAVAICTVAVHAQRIEIDDTVDGSTTMQIAKVLGNGGGLLTHGGQRLVLTPKTEIVLGKSSLLRRDAQRVLTPGTPLRVLEGHRAGKHAVVVERLEILPQ